IFRIESQRLGQHQREAAHQQACSHQEHQRKSYFRDDQHGTRQLVVASGGGTAASFLERFKQCGARNLNCRSKAKKYSSGHGNQDREAEHGAINGDPFRMRNARALPGDDGVAHDVDAAVGEQNANRRTDEREERAFRQELPENSLTARAQRNAQCDFAFADCGASKHQVRDVRAGDQQNKRHSGEEKQQTRTERADEFVVEADHAKSVLLIEAWELFFELLLNGYHFGVGLGNRHAVFEPRENHEFVIFAIELGTIKCEWLPQFEIRQCAIERKAVRQDSDHGVWFFVQQNRLAENSGIAAVMALPQAITQKDDLLVANLFIVGRKVPADYWRDAQHAEKISGYLRAPDPFGTAAARNREGQRARCGKLLENVIHVAPIQEFRSRGGASCNVAVRVRLPNGDDPARIRKRQRFQQNSVDHAENHDVRGYADRQRQNGDRRETQVSPQHAQAVTEIVPKCVHNFRPQEASK